jgi:hypothetical protein
VPETPVPFIWTIRPKGLMATTLPRTRSPMRLRKRRAATMRTDSFSALAAARERALMWRLSSS